MKFSWSKDDCKHDDSHICADCVDDVGINIPDNLPSKLVLKIICSIFIVCVLILISALAYVLSPSSINAPLGGDVTIDNTITYKEVPKETKTKLANTWEYVFRNDITGELITQQVSQAEYDTWLQNSMTIPNYPQPQLEGYTWVSAVGAKENIVTEPVVLKKGEYIVLTEDTATTTASYKVYDGTKEATLTTKP